MNFKILTYEGINIDVDRGPELKDFCAQLNNPGLFTLALGGEVLAKDLFKTIIPAGELTGAYEVHTKDGEVYLTDIDGFNAEELSARTNTSREIFMLIGHVLLQRHNLKRVRKVPTT